MDKEEEIVEQLKQISSKLDVLNDKSDERVFQLEILKLQQDWGIFGSIISFIVSVFVALFTTQLILSFSLSNYIPKETLICIFLIEIGMALGSIVISWRFIKPFRDRRITQIKNKFHLNQSAESKPRETEHNSAERTEMSKETKKSEEKIDSLLRDSEETKQERKRERTLSKIDGLYNLLITLSTFAIGIMISQGKIIVTNVLISFPIIGIVICMIISFIIGVKGMINNSMENRMLSYCLLLSLPMWYMAIPILVVASYHLTDLQLKIATATTAIILSGLTLIFSKVFIQWLKKKLPYLFEQEAIKWGKVAFKTMVYVFVIVLLTFIATLIVFWVSLPSLLNSPPLRLF